MIFNEVGYFVLFLLPTVASFHLSPRNLRPWLITLGGAGFFLYFSWIHFGGLWGALTILLILAELGVSRLYRRGSRWCVFGIVLAIAILAAFKYLVFFRGAWNDLASLSVWLPRLDGSARLILPLGISFFTFEFIHYAIDAYRGGIIRSRLGDYASFIFFFPTMVSGPIKRFQEFIPQVHSAKFDLSLACRGVARIGIGLVKKYAIADSLGLWSDQLNSPALQSATPLAVIGWIFAYGGKIYFDFSGYSDLAIGSGNLFGISIPENFDWPYLSRNISEFWRRWHISLGRWIFDYIYIPLGGSRGGIARTCFNLMITFTLSGLWHGAAYNFILWGAWHGGLMCVHRLWGRYAVPRGWRIPAPAAMGLTFVSVNLGWAFFCMDIGTVLAAFRRIVGLA